MVLQLLTIADISCAHVVCWYVLQMGSAAYELDLQTQWYPATLRRWNMPRESPPVERERHK